MSSRKHSSLYNIIDVFKGHIAVFRSGIRSLVLSFLGNFGLKASNKLVADAH